jgi:hypothetical protein
MSALIELSNESHMTSHECHESHASVERPSDHTLMKTIKQSHKQQKNLLHKLQEQGESTSKTIVSSISTMTTEQKQIIHQISQEQKELVTLLEKLLSKEDTKINHQLLCNDIIEGIQLFTKTNLQLLKQDQRQHIEENINKLNDTIQKSHLDMISETLKQLKLNQQDLTYTKSSINALPNTISSIMSNVPKTIILHIQDTLQKAMQKNDNNEELKSLKTTIVGMKQDIMSLINLQKEQNKVEQVLSPKIDHLEGIVFQCTDKVEQMIENQHHLLKNEAIEDVHELKQQMENLHHLLRNEATREVHDIERIIEERTDMIQQTIEELRITNHRIGNDNIDKISNLLSDNQKIEEELLSGLQTTLHEQTLSLHSLLEKFIESISLQTRNNNQQLSTFLELTKQQHNELLGSTTRELQLFNQKLVQLQDQLHQQKQIEYQQFNREEEEVSVPSQHSRSSIGSFIVMTILVFTFFSWILIGFSPNPDTSMLYG